MSIAIRILLLLCCAYAGWEAAGIQYGELQEPQHEVRSPIG